VGSAVPEAARLQQETSGGNYSQVGFQYDGQSAASASLGGSSTAPSQLSPTSEESELPFVLPYTLMLVPPLDMQLVSSRSCCETYSFYLVTYI